MRQYQYRNMRDLVKHTAEKFPDQRFFISRDEQVPYVTGKELYKLGGKLGFLLEKQGKAGTHIAIYGSNSAAWLSVFFAAIGAGAVAVPIPVGSTPDDIAYFVEKSESTIFVYDEKFADVAEELIRVNKSVVCEPMHLYLEAIKSIKELIYPEIDDNDLAALYFTSGTTERSRCVMLTHKNMASDVCGATDAIYVKKSDVLLSLLPPTHTYEMISDICFSLHYGCTTYINERMSRMRSNFKEFQPTIIVVVPAILQTVYKEVMKKVAKAGKERQFAIIRRISRGLLRCHIDITDKLFASLKEIFGGKLRFVVCGGAALDPEIIRFFQDAGIAVYQGYGITECSPVTAVNNKHHNMVGSLGRPLNCNKVKIIDGEICFQGDNVSPGYYHDPELTAQMFDDDGTFHTGDLGYVDILGFIHFTGRVKNLIILSNGENISPEEIEEKLYRIVGVSDAVAYGEDDRITAEIYADRAIIPDEDTLWTFVKQVNAELPMHKRISKVVLRDTPFEKTTTNKIKRGKVHS